MPLLPLADAKAIKLELLEQVVREPQKSAGSTQFQTLAETPKEILPLAVGISRSATSGGYAIAIRVQTGSEPARRAGERLRQKAEDAGADVDLAEMEDAMVPAPGAQLAPGHSLLTSRATVLRPGLSIGHASGGIGSLGCFVEKAGEPALVSCSHVLAESGYIDRVAWIHHPGGKPDVNILGGNTRIARLNRDFIEFSTVQSNTVDAALAMLFDPDQVNYENRIVPGLSSPHDGKMLSGVLPFAEIEPRLGARVGKVGRTTGYTEGTLRSVLEFVRVANAKIPGQILRFENAVEVLWDNDQTPFTRAGDSGAAVFLCEDLRVLGLHFASPGKRSFACSFEEVLAVFNASWVA